MKYNGKWSVFPFERVTTYPISERKNKVGLSDLVQPSQALKCEFKEVNASTRGAVESVAAAVLEARRKKQPVLWFTGAHMIKNGLSPLLIDLVKRGLITHVAGNGATAIHDFELGMIGETSENVPNALPEGRFGMAYETGYFMNLAMQYGEREKWGLGESLARMILGELSDAVGFKYPEVSFIAQCLQADTPVTIHVGMGTDITDQHPNFDGSAKGGCSGRDFGVYAWTISKMREGGVVLNIGSAVTGPEVFLKAISMAGNIGVPPKNIITADFDLRPIQPENSKSEDAWSYYCRDYKSVVTRIPEAFGGRGYYVQGNQRLTLPLFYKLLVQ